MVIDAVTDEGATVLLHTADNQSAPREFPGVGSIEVSSGVIAVNHIDGRQTAVYPVASVSSVVWSEGKEGKPWEDR